MSQGCWHRGIYQPAWTLLRDIERDILFHLASHGAYHRGQISVTLRHSNLEPVNTDYITFVRELAGQPWKS